MSNLSTEGKLKRIHEEQIINERFKKREFVIESEEQYSQTLIFQTLRTPKHDDLKRSRTSVKRVRELLSETYLLYKSQAMFTGLRD